MSRRSAAEDLVFAAMPASGSSLSLDVLLEALAPHCKKPYDVVSSLVRKGMFVVEFEAEPRPFPFRDLLIRRL